MSRTADPTTKIALLRAAESVFAEKGLVLAKVEEITKRAGTSKGAFYLHFGSKEEAFEHVVESFLARCSAMLPPPESLPVAATAAEWLDAWLRIDQDMLEFLWANRAIVVILMGCERDHEYLLRAFNEECHARCTGWIVHGQQHGVFREDVDPDLASTLMNGAYDRLVRGMIGMKTKPPIEDWLRNAQSIFGRGLGTPMLVDALDEFGNPPVSGAVQEGKTAKTRRTKAASR